MFASRDRDTEGPMIRTWVFGACLVAALFPAPLQIKPPPKVPEVPCVTSWDAPKWPARGPVAQTDRAAVSFCEAAPAVNHRMQSDPSSILAPGLPPLGGL